MPCHAHEVESVLKEFVIDMEYKFTLTMEAGQDGFILFECPLCRESFKLRAEDYGADDRFEFWCPSCGLKSDSYIPRSVMETARAKALNMVMGEIGQSLRQLATHDRHSLLSISVKTDFKHESEGLLLPDVRMFEEVRCDHCDLSFMVHPLVRFTGCYCPFCGDSL